MTHPQDVAVPGLPEPELPPLPATQLRFQVELTPTGERLDYTARDMNARYVEGYEAGRAAGRAAAEPEGFVLVPREPTESMVYEAMDVHIDSGDGVIGLDHAEVLEVWSAMLAAAPTPTASIAPKAEGEAVAYVDPDTLARLKPGGIVVATLSGGSASRFTTPLYAAPVAQAAAGASLAVRLRRRITTYGYDAEKYGLFDLPLDLLALIDEACHATTPEPDADRASGGGV